MYQEGSMAHDRHNGQEDIDKNVPRRKHGFADANFLRNFPHTTP